MQWLTAVLAFATTMLIFAIIVTTLVETIHRAIGSRIFGFKIMLEAFYDQVLKKHVKEEQIGYKKEEFIETMMSVRSGNGNIVKDITRLQFWKFWGFNLLSSLPIETFMERLGTSEFSTVLENRTEQQQIRS